MIPVHGMSPWLSLAVNIDTISSLYEKLFSSTELLALFDQYLK